MINYLMLSFTACGTTEYLNSAGYVSSPGFPNDYAHGLDCSYNLKSNGQMSLTISFLTIDLEVTDGCRYDWVEARIKTFETNIMLTMSNMLYKQL